LPYIISQILGAICASIVVCLLFPGHLTLGATMPSGTSLQSFTLETLLTFVLMLTIINVATGSKEKGTIAGIGHWRCRGM